MTCNVFHYSQNRMNRKIMGCFLKTIKQTIQIFQPCLQSCLNNRFPVRILNCFRSSHRRCSLKKGVPKIFAKFAGKHLCQSLIFNKVANFIKKETLTLVFSYEFCEIFKNTFFTEHLRATTSAVKMHAEYG